MVFLLKASDTDGSSGIMELPPVQDWRPIDVRAADLRGALMRRLARKNPTATDKYRWAAEEMISTHRRAGP